MGLFLTCVIVLIVVVCFSVSSYNKKAEEDRIEAEKVRAVREKERLARIQEIHKVNQEWYEIETKVDTVRPRTVTTNYTTSGSKPTPRPTQKQSSYSKRSNDDDYSPSYTYVDSSPSYSPSYDSSSSYDSGSSGGDSGGGGCD